MFAQRTLGSSGGRHCKSLEGNVWRKVVSRYKKTIFERDQPFSAVVFIANGFGQYRYVEYVSFCLNNR